MSTTPTTTTADVKQPRPTGKKRLIAMLEDIIILHNKMRNCYFFDSPGTASSRRYYESNNSMDTEFVYDGHKYKVDQNTSCSCKNVYYRMHIYIDGNETKKDIRLIKSILKTVNPRNSLLLA